MGLIGTPTNGIVLSVAAGRPIIDPRHTRRDSWNNSRQIVNPDGTLEPVLVALAKYLYPEVNIDRCDVYWKDRDWTNETPENVGIGREVHRRAASSYGVPSGTPEYWTRYRAAKKEKMREYQAKYKEKRRQMQAKTVEANQTRLDGGTTAKQDFADKMNEELHKLLDTGATIEQLQDARIEMELERRKERKS